MTGKSAYGGAGRLIRIVSRAAAVLFFAALISLAPAKARAEVVDRVVAIINDSIITLSELNAATALAVDKLPGAEKVDGVKIVELKTSILDSLIEQKLVKQASDSAGIAVSEREVDNAVEEVKRQNRLTHEELMLALGGSGLTYAEYREQMREQIRQVKFLNNEFRSRISIQDEEIEDYYRQHIEELIGPPTARIRMIFLSSADNNLLKRRRDAIEAGLKNGETFSSLASQYSEGASASSGGDMGSLPINEMDASLKAEVKKLSPGGISPWVEKPEGIYRVQLVERVQGRVPPLEEVKNVIYDKIFNKTMADRFSSWLADKKRYAHIEIRM